MSRDFTKIIPQSRGYKSSLDTIGVKYNTPIDMTIGARTLPVRIDWADYGANTANPSIAVSIDLNTSTSIDVFRSIIVDNTFSLFAIYIYFEDTKMTYVCPPNSTLQTPILTNNKKCIVYCEGMQSGFTPITNIQFTNVIIPPLVVSNPYLPPASIVYVSSGATSMAVPQSIINLNGIPIGAADDTRIVAISITCGTENGVGTNAEIVGFALNGVQMTPIAGERYPSLGIITAIFYMQVPTGNLADLSISTDIPIEFFTVAIYDVYNAQSPVPDSGGLSVGALGNRQITMNMKQGAVALFASASSSLVAPYPAVAWSGVSSVNFSGDNSLAPNYTRAQGAIITGQNVTGVITVSANAANILTGVSWR